MIAGRAGPLVCAGAIFLAVAAAAEGDAGAARLTVSLEYVAGPGCPDAADFKAVVIARLGYDPFVESAPERVLVSIGPRGDATDGRIEWRDSTGNWTGDQTFPSVSTDCPRLVRAIGFALAVQIQLLGSADAPRGADGAAPADVASPSEAPAVRPIAAPAGANGLSNAPPAAPDITNVPAPATSGPRAVFAMGAGPSVGFGMSSTPILLGRVFGALAWQHLSVELAAAVSLPSTTRRADGAGFSQQHLLASVAACAVVTRWSACLLANAGESRMNGENIDRPASAVVPVVEAGARVGVSQRLGRHAFLNAHADGLINVTRWTASLDQVPVWTAPRFGAALGVDAGIRFP